MQTQAPASVPNPATGTAPKLDILCDHGCAAQYDEGLLAFIPDEVRSFRPSRGAPFPDLLEGQTVLVLNSGSGFDAFVLSKMAGPHGRVIGFDTRPEMVELARRHVDAVTRSLGYEKPNVEFVTGDILKLPLADASVDVVVTNCALALTPKKEDFFREIKRVLKVGGEFMANEVISDRRVPRSVQLAGKQNKCLTQAVYAGDLRRLMQKVGFFDVRNVWKVRIEERISGVRFNSVTLRGFNLPLEDACEDYGQSAIYLGTIPGREDAMDLDLGHSFKKDQSMDVCKNTADMLNKTRYKAHFQVAAEGLHGGLFDCGPGTAEAADADDDAAAAACSPGGGCC